MTCLSCGFEYSYEDEEMMVCSACQYTWPKETDDRAFIFGCQW